MARRAPGLPQRIANGLLSLTSRQGSLGSRARGRFSIFAGTTQQAYDTPGRDVAVNRGNSIVTLDVAQSAVWAEAAQPVYGAWIEEMKGRGLDGQAMIDQATALMNAN